jgi:hypothetical protein
MRHTPPRWAEAWLRLLLPARDQETVSGDLLEQYRDSVRPSEGRLRANAWYIAQVAGFTWRSSRVTVALLLLLSFLSQAVLGPWAIGGFEGRAGLAATIPPAWLLFAPPVLVLLWAGGWASWRASRLWAGTAVGFVASLLVTKVLLTAMVLPLVVWQPQLAKIGMSWESLRDLTLILVSTTAAGTAIATLGGLAATLARRANRSYLGIEH